MLPSACYIEQLSVSYTMCMNIIEKFRLVLLRSERMDLDLSLLNAFFLLYHGFEIYFNRFIITDEMLYVANSVIYIACGHGAADNPLSPAII